jgi:UPF0716 protein FxsA
MRSTAAPGRNPPARAPGINPMTIGRLALLIVLVPIIELVLLIQLGGWIGFWPTVGLVLLTGAAGVVLARLEGLRVFFQLQHELARGQLPGRALLDGVSVLLGGVLLLAPGILTDLLGFSLLFPPTRRWIQNHARGRLERRLRDGSIRMARVGVATFRARGGGGAEGGGAQQAAPDELGPVDEQGRALDPSKSIVVE